MKFKSFTLLELLIVIAIIAIMASILLPTLQNTKNKTYTISCSSQERQIAFATQSYANDYNDYLPHSGMADTATTSTWSSLIASYLNIEKLNVNLLQKGIFNCPAQKNGNCGNSTMGYLGFYGGYGWNYTYIGWRPGMSGYLDYVQRISIKKPTSTIMMGDTSDDKTTSGTGQGSVHFYLYYPASFPAINYYASRHSNGGNMVWCDGHVSTHKRTELIKNAIWYKRY